MSTPSYPQVARAPERSRSSRPRPERRRRRPIAAALGALVASVLVVVALLANGDATDPALRVRQEEFGQAWPLTVSSGNLRCDQQVVTFQSGSATYTLSRPTPRGENSNDVAPIWAQQGPGLEKKDLMPMIQKGLSLCR